jgi:hypothetical protein
LAFLSLQIFLSLYSVQSCWTLELRNNSETLKEALRLCHRFGRRRRNGRPPHSSHFAYNTNFVPSYRGTTPNSQ